MRIFWTSIFILYFGIAFGQYTGGNKDGYVSGINSNVISIYRGSPNDGYVSSTLNNNLSIYTGATEDGYAVSSLKENTSIYTGATEDGYAVSSFNNTISIYAGGVKDGYALDKKILTYIWTGALDDDWNNIGNWQIAIIPNINSNVVIPSGATNFPVLNAGLMSIGQNMNGALFFCKQIDIQSGAQMTYTSSAFLEIYGVMNISGTVFGYNSAVDACVIQSGGLLNIYNHGSLIFQ